LGSVVESEAISGFRAARDHVLETVAAACARAGRDPADVTLVAVSKTVDAGRLAAAVAAGLTLLGENRVQEAESKVSLLPGAR
jgi:PLP dependent protein